MYLYGRNWKIVEFSLCMSIVDKIQSIIAVEKI